MKNAVTATDYQFADRLWLISKTKPRPKVVIVLWPQRAYLIGVATRGARNEYELESNTSARPYGISKLRASP